MNFLPQPMGDSFETFRKRRDGVTGISTAVVLSMLIHAAVLWWQPPLRLPSAELGKPDRTTSALAVQLAPPTPPPRIASSRPMSETQRPQPVRRSKAAAPPRAKAARPSALALKEPAPDTSPPSSPPPPAPATTPAPPSPAGDLSSYIEARRRARGESPANVSSRERLLNRPTAEDENTRASRIAAANLGLDRRPTFGPNPTPGGGIFSLQHVSYDYAEFMFFGWNKDIRRNTAQLVEVRRGNASDIRIAVILKMIAIIREHEQGDFVWESTRLGRNVTLSARPRDDAGLQDFLMAEFFEEFRRSR